MTVTITAVRGDAILRLVWASKWYSSKQELESEGTEFRLIGRSQ